MPSPSHKSNFPTASLSGRQVVYVTDNLRDAEALQFLVDSPVLLRLPAEPPISQTRSALPYRLSRRKGRHDSARPR